MAGPQDTDGSRKETDRTLRAERDRSDDELLTRVHALAEDSEAIIDRARDRARQVLELVREREDRRMVAHGATAEQREDVNTERRLEDVALAEERATADAHWLDEYERRRLAVIQLLAHERGLTDQMLAAERRIVDRSLSAREDVLGHVAHDLRNIVQTIIVNASVILIAPTLEATQTPAAAIQRATAQMNQLLEELIDVSILEAGHQRLDTDPVNLSDLVQDAVAIHEAVAADRGLHLIARAPATLIARIDGRRILRVLANLIGNALKFTPAGGTVEIQLDRVGDECELVVRDDGIGIPEDQRQAIFERFRQFGGAPRLAGVGLGLYIARLIVEAHGGRIWAESPPSAGASFHVRLPLA
jgi:signal transduction histidine kinase